MKTQLAQSKNISPQLDQTDFNPLPLYHKKVQKVPYPNKIILKDCINISEKQKNILNTFFGEVKLIFKIWTSPGFHGNRKSLCKSF